MKCFLIYHSYFEKDFNILNFKEVRFSINICMYMKWYYVVCLHAVGLLQV